MKAYSFEVYENDCFSNPSWILWRSNHVLNSEGEESASLKVRTKTRYRVTLGQPEESINWCWNVPKNIANHPKEWTINNKKILHEYFSSLFIVISIVTLFFLPFSLATAFLVLGYYCSTWIWKNLTHTLLFICSVMVSMLQHSFGKYKSS